jgi:hypothetical protein
MLFTTPEEDEKANKAITWWRSLSYNEQNAIANKNGNIYVFRCQYGILSGKDILDMMKKEGI